MRISLVWKITGALVLVAVVSVLTVSLFASRFTGQEFDRFRNQQQQAEYVAFLENHLQTHGTFAGAEEALQQYGRRPPPFLLTRLDGVVLQNTRQHRAGDQLPARELKNAVQVKVEGKAVALVVPLGPDGPSPQEQAFLQRTTSALQASALVALLVAVGLGLVLARVLLRPLGQLKASIHELQAGRPLPEVQKVSQDELGEVIEAFQVMGEQLTRSHRLRRQMTADIAHDLHTPLTVLKGYLEAMEEGTLHATPERIRTLHREALHLSELVSDLRTLSLADAGELHLQKTSVLVEDLLHEAVGTFMLPAEQNGVQLRVEAPADLLHVQVDPTRMLQVLKNLISNALKHTPAGGTVWLRGKHTPENILLEVQDTGSGIDPEHLPLIFERFHRADEARTGHSSGLGLAICKSIIEAHGGTIKAHSTPGTGTTLHILLPHPG